MSLFKRKPKGEAPSAEPLGEAADLGPTAPLSPVSPPLPPRPARTVPAPPPPAVRNTDAFPIVPVLQPGAWYRDTCAQIPDEQWWPLTDQLPNDLVVTFAFDRPDHYETLTPARLRALGRDRADVAAEAYATLAQRASGAVVAGQGGRYRVELPSHPDLTASLMLNAKAWLRPEQIQGRPVLAAARRIMLHVCGADDAGSVAGLAQLNRDLYDGPAVEGKALTPDLFTVDAAGQLAAWSG
jgi:hypothetical protein